MVEGIKGVQTGPGTTAFTRTRHFIARPLVKVASASFVEA
jgi:hypothetical protein